MCVGVCVWCLIVERVKTVLVRENGKLHNISALLRKVTLLIRFVSLRFLRSISEFRMSQCLYIVFVYID